MGVENDLERYRNKAISRSSDFENREKIKDTEELRLVESVCELLDAENLHRQIHHELFNDLDFFYIRKENYSEMDIRYNFNENDNRTRTLFNPNGFIKTLDYNAGMFQKMAIRAESKKKYVIDAHWITKYTSDGYRDEEGFYIASPEESSSGSSLGFETHVYFSRDKEIVKALVLSGSSFIGIINLCDPYNVYKGKLNKTITDEKKEEFKGLLLDACLYLEKDLPLREKKPWIFNNPNITFSISKSS